MIEFKCKWFQDWNKNEGRWKKRDMEKEKEKKEKKKQKQVKNEFFKDTAQV